MKTFNQRQATLAALQNKQLTRERVDRLEEQVKRLQQAQRESYSEFCRFVWHRRLRARLRWLLRGR